MDYHTQSTQSESGADQGGAPGVILGRPTVTSNNGAEVSKDKLPAFECTDISQAEYIRLPAPGARCRLSHLSRTTLNELGDRGEIKIITVRRPGATRGIKLINKASLLGYLRRLEAEQCGKEDGHD